MSNGDVGFMVRNDVDPGSIEVEIVEHPRIRPLNDPENRNMLEPAASKPPDPPFRAVFLENDEPILGLALRKPQTAKTNLRSHRDASISCEP